MSQSQSGRMQLLYVVVMVTVLLFLFVLLQKRSAFLKVRVITMTDLVVGDDAVSESLVEHLLVPLLESLWLRNLLIQRMAVEDVVITLAWGTRPDVSSLEANH